MSGVVYFIRFTRPLARKSALGNPVVVDTYVGWANSLEHLPTRLTQHLTGRGARITAAAVEQGSDLRLVGVILDADRTVERAIKNRKNAKQTLAQLESGTARGWLGELDFVPGSKALSGPF